MTLRQAAQGFGETTTFHGPNHGYAAKTLPEKFFWYLVFAIGLCLAGWQSWSLIDAYLNNQHNRWQVAKEIDPFHMGKLVFTACPLTWIDRDKVNRAVADGNFTYANLLFALSTIPSLDTRVLQMMEEWDEIPDSQRIWGIRKQVCLNGHARRKRLSAPGEMPISLPIATSQPSSVNSDTPNTITEEDFTTLLTGQLGSGQIDQLMKNITSRVCQEIECRPDEMENWEQQSSDFYDKTRKRYKDLNEFLASVSIDQTPIEIPNATRVGHVIAHGQICQVVQLNNPLQSSVMQGKVQLANRLSSFLSRGDIKAEMGKYMHIVYPGTTGHTYGSGGPSVEKLRREMDPRQILSELLNGHRMLVEIKLPGVSKIWRRDGCDSTPSLDSIAPIEGTAAEQCRRRCAYAHTKGPSGYRLVSRHSIGPIGLDQKLAPARFAAAQVDNEAAAICEKKQGCDKKVYCTEWRSAVGEMTSEKVMPKSSGNCTTEIDRELSWFQVNHHLGSLMEIEDRGAVNPVDVVGMVGGLLGLYLGASLVTILHACIYWITQLVTCCKGWPARRSGTSGQGLVERA